MGKIVIKHTREAGTLILGTEKGDGSAAIIRRSRGFRGSRELPDGAYWYIPNSQDESAREWVIDRCAAALRAEGFEVEVEIDNVTPAQTSFAEREAAKYERAEERADRFGEYADHAAERGGRLLDQAREERSRIPFGQPMMHDHHSYAADRNRRERTHRKEARGYEAVDRSEHWAGRAAAAESFQGRREDIPTTLRRIKGLIADRNRLEAALAGRTDMAETQARLDRVNEEIEYWDDFVAKAEAEGVKVWRPTDFKPGDLVGFGYGWFEVLKVNKATLTVPGRAPGSRESPFTKQRWRARFPRGGHTDTIAYDGVRGRMPAELALERFPEAFAEPEDAPPPPPAKKRGKVKLEHSTGAMHEGWWFDAAGRRFYVQWRWPEGWLQAADTAAPFDQPGDLVVQEVKGLSSYTRIAIVAVIGPIRYVEEVHNQVREWVEAFAVTAAAE